MMWQKLGERACCRENWNRLIVCELPSKNAELHNFVTDKQYVRGFVCMIFSNLAQLLRDTCTYAGLSRNNSTVSLKLIFVYILF